MIVQTGGYTRSTIPTRKRCYVALECDRCHEAVNMLRFYWKPNKNICCPGKGCGGRLLASGQWGDPRELTPDPDITRPNPPRKSPRKSPRNSPLKSPHSDPAPFTPRSFTFTTYAEYLASDLWQHIRGAVYRRDQGICQVCLRKGSQVHHLSYAQSVLEGRHLDQLVLVCRECHRKLEFDRHGNKRSTIKAAKVYFRLIAKRTPKKPVPKHEHRRLKRHSGNDPFAKTLSPRHAILGKERGSDR